MDTKRSCAFAARLSVELYKFLKDGRLPLFRCLDLMSKQAGALFGLRCGRIEEGSLADLVLFDLEQPLVVDESFFA